MSLRLCVVLVISACAFGGCATITSGDTQQVSIQTTAADGQEIEKADCILSNDKGRWTARSPAIVAVRRSSEDLVVECSKAGAADGLLRAISRAKAAMLANIFAVGALVDHATGSAYDYPDDLAVKMGKTGVMDKRDERARKQQAEARPADIKGI
jgi:hypothetical protein